MLEAHRHDLGPAYGFYHTQEAQARARDIMGINQHDRVMVCVAVGYVDDDPVPSGSTLARILQSLDSLYGRPRSPDWSGETATAETGWRQLSLPVSAGRWRSPARARLTFAPQCPDLLGKSM